MKPIFLIGFMGAGKTTLGRALAGVWPAGGSGAARPVSGSPARNVEYVDLDEYIERSHGMSVGDIFRQEGEASFRAMEAGALRELGVRHNLIVGCGGGTPCHGGNMEWMNRHGLTVLLEASRPVLLRRLLEAQDGRPLLAGLSAHEVECFIASRLADREPFYSMAQLRFPSDRLETPDEVADSCAEFMSLVSPFLD